MDALCGAKIGYGDLGSRRRSFEQPFLVAPVCRKKRKSLDSILWREEVGNASGFEGVAGLAVPSRS